MAKYLKGKALDKHWAAVAKAIDELDKTRPFRAEGDLETLCVLEDIPLWQSKTECVQAFVSQGRPLDEMLKKYELTEEEYKLNLERLARGEGVDF